MMQLLATKARGQDIRKGSNGANSSNCQIAEKADH